MSFLFNFFPQQKVFALRARFAKVQVFWLYILEYVKIVSIFCIYIKSYTLLNAAFLVLCGNTTGTSFGRPEGLPSVAKELWVRTLKGTLRRGTSPQKAMNYVMLKYY